VGLLTEDLPRPFQDRSTGLRMDPRIGRRWVEVRRQQGRRRLRILMIAGAAVLVLALGAGSLYTPLFKVRHVRASVRGAMPPSEVVKLSGVSGRTLMVRVNDAAIERRLDAVPSLGESQVTTHWPGTVSIRVAVRQAVALIAETAGNQPASRWEQIDATGRVIAVVSAPSPGLPLLKLGGVPTADGQWLPGSPGPSVSVPAAGTPGPVDLGAASDSPAVPQGVAAALAVAAALPPQIRGYIQTIAAGGSGGLSLIAAPTEGSAGPVSVDLGDGSELAAKITALTTLLTQTNLTGVTGLDLTVPDRPAALTGQRSPDSLSTHAGGSH